MKKVVIVNCFDTYEERIDLLHDSLRNAGYDITVIQSGFRHFKKVHRTDNKQNFIFVKSKPYYKNMSIARLSSHYLFAKHAFKLIEEINPDILYVTIPPNSLAKFAAEYKRKHKGVKLIFDLIDLWPETMPIGNIKKVPPFTFWKMLRDMNLKYADLVITECNLYSEVLKRVLNGIKTKTVYLAKSDIKTNSNFSLNLEEMQLCYLGSINNIIDIDKIKSLLKEINKRKSTTLHIIGDGESKDFFIKEVESTGVKVKFHGKIYDPQKKQEIFDVCQFGINIMKESVCVGLTMKSIDYFQLGLPIINNIKKDTHDLVNKYNIGINLSNMDYGETASKIIELDIDDHKKMRKNTKMVYECYFSRKAFEKNMNFIFKEIKETDTI